MESRINAVFRKLYSISFWKVCASWADAYDQNTSGPNIEVSTSAFHFFSGSFAALPFSCKIFPGNHTWGPGYNFDSGILLSQLHSLVAEELAN